MFCGKCGIENGEDFQFCKQCGDGLTNQSINTNITNVHPSSDYLKQLYNLNPNEEVLALGNYKNLYGLNFYLLLICIFIGLFLSMPKGVDFFAGVFVVLPLVGYILKYHERVEQLNRTIKTQQLLIVTNKRLVGKVINFPVKEKKILIKKNAHESLVDINYPLNHIVKVESKYHIGDFKNAKTITLTTAMNEVSHFLCLENHYEILDILQKLSNSNN